MMSGFTTMDHTNQEFDGMTQVNTNDDQNEDDQRKSAATEDKRNDYRKKKDRVFDFKDAKNAKKSLVHPMLQGSPSAELNQSSKTHKSRSGSSVDVGHGTKRGSGDDGFGVNIKKKLSVQTTRHLHAGPNKHEFFFQHSNFI